MGIKKRGLILLGILLLVVLFFVLSAKQVSADVSYCCEKTTSGAWCQNVNDTSLCATGNGLNRPVATSCSSTSYCSVGTCINGAEGTCDRSTQRACTDNGGTWDSKNIADIPQCQLGCCLIGDSSSFTTEASCTRQGALYNQDVNFRSDIKNQDQCTALAFPKAKGACVFDDGVESPSCQILTKQDCLNNATQSAPAGTNVTFHQGLLCTAASLGTKCGQTDQTTCVPGKFGVYFVDTCGNIANVYDSSKTRDTNYWTYITDPIDSCGNDSSNAKNPNCGNCDYFAGSTCKAYQRNDTHTVKPTSGNYVCADLGCTYNGQNYQHEESWCGPSSGFNQSLPGSESEVLTCVAGKIIPNACSPLRQQICQQQEIAPGFTVASCVLNQYQDCFLQQNKTSCEDTQQRNCKWLVNETNNFFRDDTDLHNKYVLNKSDDSLVTVQDALDSIQLGGAQGYGDLMNLTQNKGASCVPNNAPGFHFWNDENRTMCMLADDSCLVVYQKGVGGIIKDFLTGGDSSWSCKENCWCVQEGGDLNQNWLSDRRALCTSLGDCGISNNYLGEPGGAKIGDDIVKKDCSTDKNGNLTC